MTRSGPRLLVDGRPLAVRRTGVGHYLSALLRSCVESTNLQLLVAVPSVRAWAPDDALQGPGLEFRHVNGIRSLGMLGASRLGVSVRLDSIDSSADVVLATRYWRTSTDRPQVSMVYDLAHIHAAWSLEHGYRRRLRRLVHHAIETAALVGVISETVKAEVAEAYRLPADRIVVLRPGLTEDQAPLTTDLSAVHVGDGFILHVGTMEPRKNLVTLVRAFRSAAKELGGRRLVLAGGAGWGDRELRAELRRAGDAVMPLGYVDDATRDALYRQADCLVVPSRYEGFGLPVLEALQRGLPVGCSDLPVFREIAGDCVRYFDPMSVDEVAQTLLDLTSLRPADRAALALRGEARAAQFEWADAARTLSEAASRLAGLQSSPTPFMKGTE